MSLTGLRAANKQTCQRAAHGAERSDTLVVFNAAEQAQAPTHRAKAWFHSGFRLL